MGSPESVQLEEGLNDLLERFARRRLHTAIVERGVAHSYGDLERRRLTWLAAFGTHGIEPGQVVAVQADFSVESLSLILALFANRNVVALIPGSAAESQTAASLEDAGAQALFQSSGSEMRFAPRRACTETHPLVASLRRKNRAGFIIFTSGSSGRPKAVLHDLNRFLRKFSGAHKKYRALAFLLLDHVAGLDTLFYTFFSGGVLVLPERRDPAYICGLVSAHHVEVLAVTPTFLNLLCLSRAYENADLSSVKVIAYSSEPMNPHTLARLPALFPHAEIIQKYGASEFGSPRSQSNPDDPRWLKLGGDDFQYKVVDDMLYVKSESAMLGYLNASDPPIDDDGWLSTGDEVEVHGDWIRILGRATDTIIVGGEKVFPSEVEAVMSEIDGIEDVLVKGEPHPITGQIVTATVTLRAGYRISRSTLAAQVWTHCRGRLQTYKIPAKIHTADGPLSGLRHKKLRS